MHEKLEILTDGLNDWTTKSLKIYKLDLEHSTHKLQHRATRHEIYKLSLVVLAFSVSTTWFTLLMLLFWMIATIETHFIRVRLEQLYYEHHQ